MRRLFVVASLALLIQAGVPCDLHHYSAAFHLAHQFPGTAIGQRMINDRIQAIRRLLPLQKACCG